MGPRGWMVPPRHIRGPVEPDEEVEVRSFKEEVAIPPGDIPKYLALIARQYERVRALRAARQELAFIEPAYPAVLLLGPPGIGKSEQVKLFALMHAEMLGKVFVDYSEVMRDGLSLAREILRNPERYYVFVDLRLTEIEPFDILGAIKLAEIDGVKFTLNHPFLWARILSKTAGLLFLDELTHVQRPDTESVALKLVLDRMAGGLRLSDDVFIIAAGNDEGESKLANVLDDALLNRFIILYVRAPSPGEFVEYLQKKGRDDFLSLRMAEVEEWLGRVLGDAGEFPDRRVLKYVLTCGSTLSRSKREGNVNMMSPRSLWRLATLIAGVRDPRVVKVLAYGLLGGDADDFVATMVLELPDVMAFIVRPEKFLSRMTPSMLAKIMEFSAGRLNEMADTDFRSAVRYAKRLIVKLYERGVLEEARPLIRNLKRSVLAEVYREIERENPSLLAELALTVQGV